MAPRSNLSDFNRYVPEDEPTVPRIVGLALVSTALALAIVMFFAVLSASRVHAADQACGVTVISTFRRGAAIAGTGGSPSMHRWCRAADFKTSRPGCVLHTLADWPHALSVDYAAVRHFHIDDGAHIRFRHGQHRARRHRVART